MYYDLLVHVDLPDEQRFQMALGNINFYKIGLPTETFSVAVVANAGAVRHLVREGNPRTEAIQKLMEGGVQFKACANALKIHNINNEDLLDGVEVVPAGVVEIVRLQREGFAYIKP